ncbi:hypothetical protein AB0L05_13755 [Nonomuraea pusilla]|uniref:hypothetical protein n=1 Tax=Nonomuraea pusilla TaxID=46177 RepID=UPI00332EAA3E
MIRRILAGAAVAGIALGLSAQVASADVGPNPYNSGTNIAGQTSLLDDLTAANNLANNSLKGFDLLSLAHVEDLTANLLNNNG